MSEADPGGGGLPLVKLVKIKTTISFDKMMIEPMSYSINRLDIILK